MAKQVTLTLKSLTDLVAEVEAIKAKITAHAGTQAERLKKAKAEALASGAVKVPTLQVKASDPLETAEALVAEWQQSLAQRIEEATTAVLRKSKDNDTAGLTALREAFKAKAEAATATKSVLVTLGIAGAEAVVIPSLKGTGRIGTGSGKSTASSGQAFWIRRNGGEKQYKPESQNKFSSIAWYHGGEIGAEADVNKSKDGFKGCGAKALEAFLKSKGVDVTAGAAWSFKASETFEVGMDVVTPEEAPTK